MAGDTSGCLCGGVGLMIGRVCEEQLHDADDQLVSLTRTFYGPESGNVLAHCEVGLGLERRVDGYLQEEQK